MEGDVAGTGLGEVTDHAVDRRDHQVGIDLGADAVITQRLAHHRPDGQVGHVMIVHHVEVDDIGPGGQHILDLLPQAGEVSGQDRRGNLEVIRQ